MFVSHFEEQDMKPNNRIHRSESDWQELIQQQAASKLSVRAFCKQRHIGDQSFYLWRKRLASLPIESPINLVDITQLVSADLSQRWHIELDLGGGIKLNLSQL